MEVPIGLSISEGRCHSRSVLALRCLSHAPLLSGYDEPETFPYQITLIGPIGADVRQLQELFHNLGQNWCAWPNELYQHGLFRRARSNLTILSQLDARATS